MNLFKKVVALEEDASSFGFAWETPSQIMEQIESECLEIHEHLNDGLTLDNSSALQEEIGDLLHAVFSLCVFCQFNPEETLEQTLGKFERRLTAVKQIAQERGLSTLKGFPFEELMAIWGSAKERVS